VIKIDGVQVMMAMERETVIANIARNSAKGLPSIQNLPEWREAEPIAIVGGGPSLKETIEDLRPYQKIMACGSVHDYLIGQGVRPRWTVVSDPDPVMSQYLKRPSAGCTYLVASMCDESVFDALHGQHVVLWHCGDQEQSPDLWGETPKLLIGGGCTVGTRAFTIAAAFGYSNIHLFGFDTCLREEEHHAYKFATPEEELGEVTEISLFNPDGPKYRLAGYHLGQLFDFKKIMETLGHKVNVTAHGGGVIAEMLKFASREKGTGDENGEEN
jgi:hypothetical protein